jgi:hypothetical protein
MAVSRQWENRIDKFLQHPVVRGLISRYAEENPEAADNVFNLVMHALIAPLCREQAKIPDGWSERDSWTIFELLLMAGMSSTDGVRLSPAQCELVFQVLSGERKRPTRRRSPNTRRDEEIADYLELLEADGWPPDAAVAKAKDVYGVARATVYDDIRAEA